MPGATLAVAVSCLVGCAGTSGTKFNVGDCISVQTNKDGGAVQTNECASSGAIKIEKLAEGGLRPDCGTGWSITKERTAIYVRDLRTDVTYCGF